MAHIRQSRPDSGLDFQAKVLIVFTPSSLLSEAVRGAVCQEWVSHGDSNTTHRVVFESPGHAGPFEGHSNVISKILLGKPGHFSPKVGPHGVTAPRTGQG